MQASTQPCLFSLPADMDASGYVPVPVLLRELRSPGVSEAVLRHIVATDAKARPGG
jgi:hypothetical protein